MGRQTTYSDEIAQEILELLAQGKSLRRICAQDGFPPESTVRRWAIDNGAFAAQYARARDLGLDAMADETFEIADGREGGDVARDRLRWDQRRWYLSKLAPKRYGDKLEVEHQGEVKVELDDQEAAKRIAFVLATAAAKRGTD
jgi:hypothetical protein